MLCGCFRRGRVPSSEYARSRTPALRNSVVLRAGHGVETRQGLALAQEMNDNQISEIKIGRED
jgi:hypothetical protein